MSEPRGVEERLRWMLDHPPGEPGMCARETWQALGGDQVPPNPPAWGAEDANAVYNKIVASGRYWKGMPPRGAFIAWKYGAHGHAALSYGDGRIVTTDPAGRPGGTGVEPITYPEKWGASSNFRIYTDQYNGVRFDIGEEAPVVQPGSVSEKFGTWRWYSGKKTDDWVVQPDEKWVDIPGFVQPASGIKAGSPVETHFLYLRVRLTAGRSADRVLQARFIRSDGDETAYDHWTLGLALDSYPCPTYHVEVGSGLGGKWQVWLTGGTDPIKIGTRYAKTFVRYHP